jgi:LVIVD repeat
LGGWRAALAAGSLATLGMTVAAITPPAQTQSQADVKSTGCLTCHQGIEPMHTSGAVRLGCTDCHGGNAAATTKEQAHVQPRNRELWKTSANPQRTYTALLQESAEFVKFVNPGDLRVAEETCGGCHAAQVNAVPRSTMTTSSVFWAAAAYANGILPTKKAILGESYGHDGNPRAVKPATPPTPWQIARGALEMFVPMPRWEIVQPGEYFRAFERGGIAQGTTPPEIGNPSPSEEAGKPDIRLGNRGRGTGLRISPGLINIHKTRLNDPHLSFLGTNDHPGDYRSSGCTACHVVYANDRDPLHSGPYAAAGNDGKSQTADSTIPKNEKGHPIRHQFTRAVPTSQCMSCHMHQPNSFVNTYLGYTMWDYETDAQLLWPKQQKYPTEAEKRASLDANPEGAAARGLWSDPDFLEKVSSLNAKAKHTQFADYHGHGWNFMAVFKRDRKGNLLDAEDNVVRFDDPNRLKKAVHLRDIHLEKGMHCADCHFSQDEHGNGQLYGEYANSIEIECQDCHGTTNRTATLRTSGPAAPPGGNDLTLGTTPDGRRRFAWINGRLMQRSMVNPGMEWDVTQIKASAASAEAHSSKHMATLTCYACHTSWMTSCSGCHLPQESNAKSEVRHFEGDTTRNFASYNPQVIRTDTFMLGVNGTTKGHKLAPVRSSSALVLSSTQAQRQRIYIQQPPISSPGFSSQAFNPHVPHTVRARETQGCNSCHLTQANDNNAWMAQLLLQGTNFVNFIGRYAWVATGEHGIEAVAVTEWEEPQAVIGSSLHSIVYPDWHKQHLGRKKELQTAHHHHGDARSLQLRGEYLFAANGEHGFEVYDVANVDNKEFSERIVSAPVSPRGQRTFVKTKFATSVALPTTMPMAFNRTPHPENEEQPIHPLYRYAYISDREEGLILVDVATLTDGDPSNNFFGRALTFPLPGAETVTIAGRYAYVGAEAGMVVVDIDQPLAPKIVATLVIPSVSDGPGGVGGAPPAPPGPSLTLGMTAVRSIAIQFRYAFATNAEGLHVIDITDPTKPVQVASVPIKDARSVYVARTYAYVAAGAQGLVIVDVERPDKPRIDQTVTEGLHDVNDVKVASTNASAFAYVADAEGLKILQLTSPEWTPAYAGFSPRPAPRLIAQRHMHGPALAVSKGLDRDRAVDESGYQVSVFNRIGARPMTLPEMQRLYLRDGKVYTVVP